MYVNHFEKAFPLLSSLYGKLNFKLIGTLKIIALHCIIPISDISPLHDLQDVQLKNEYKPLSNCNPSVLPPIIGQVYVLNPKTSLTRNLGRKSVLLEKFEMKS